MSEKPSLDFGRYKGRPITDVPDRLLKRYHGELQGRNDVIADELRRRGLNSTQLRELEWEHSQSLWRLSARKATVVRVIRRKKKQKKKLRNHRKRQAQRRIEAVRKPFARIERGGTTAADNKNETKDGTVPFVGDGSVTSKKARLSDEKRQ